MRRLMYFLLLVIIVGTSARCVNASTDCERWFAAYHNELLHSQQMQRIAAAKRRAKLYAKRKLAGYIKPPVTTKPKPAHHPMPHRQALQHFELACGVLPETSQDQPLIAEEIPGDFAPEIPADEVGLLPGFDGPGSLLPEDSPQPPEFTATPPVGGGAPIISPPYTSPVGGGPGGGGPVTPPPISPVPEPGSFALLLTGGIGAAGIIRRRFSPGPAFLR
jgi:PEP-CTERM motif